MTSAKRRPARSAAAPVLALLGLSAFGLPCAAQQAASAPAAPAASGAEGDSVTEDLIRMLQQRNALSPDEAQSLITRLRKKAAAPAAAAAAAPAQPQEQAQPQTQVAAPSGPTVAEPKKNGDVRVMYIPESEKQRIRDEVKQEVLATAKAENWAQPWAMPEWIKRIHFGGDILFRQEFDFWDHANDPMVNYYAINSGAPYDVSLSDGNTVPPPLLDTTQMRELPRLRFRLDMNAKVADDLDVGMRLSTGNDTNPVATDQVYPADATRLTVGLDRAFLDYHPLSGFHALAGRIPNPFVYTNLVWDDDLNFDGLALQYAFDFDQWLRPFVNVGAFSVENSSYNLSSNGINNGPSHDKWLYAAQLGADWKLTEGTTITGAVALYDFARIAGELSSPCAPVTSSVVCDSDDTRALFLQKGNTLFALRDPSLTSTPNAPEYQYFGLASPFRELNALLRFDIVLRGGMHWILEGDYVNNLAFSPAHIQRLQPVTNLNVNGNTFMGGNNGYHIMMQVGRPVIAELGQWNVLGGYKRIESDAVVDAFTDSTFHVGGTNAKGYYIQGNLGFTHNAWVDARWFSTSEASGPPLAVDVLQVDVNARF